MIFLQLNVTDKLIVTVTIQQRRSLSFEIVNLILHNSQFNHFLSDESILTDISLELVKSVAFMSSGFDVNTIDLEEYEGYSDGEANIHPIICL